MKVFKIFIQSLFLIGFLFHANSMFAQKKLHKETLLIIDEEKISVGEFLQVYNKNNVEGQVIDQKSIDEYLELFIDYKLKVNKAKALGMDTLQSFKEELAGYRKQLAEPYFLDEKMNSKLIKEAYQRMLYDIRASHILIRLNENASPEDTLAAYQKIMKIRYRIMAGEDFVALAKEYSEDESAKDHVQMGRNVKGNGGDLGYFTAFDMVYPFESAAYNLKPGEVSMPVRTAFGYHIIIVTDKLPAMGRVQVAHIMLVESNNEDKEALAKEAYQKIQNGEKFEALVKEYSDDKSSAANGGVLPWFGVNRVLPKIISEVHKLKPEDISEPFHSIYGWHIIKLLNEKKPQSFEDEKNHIKQKIAKSDRSLKSKESVVQKIKNDYGFSENKDKLKQLYSVVEESLKQEDWSGKDIQQWNDEIFKIGDKGYTQKDLLTRVYNMKMPRKDIGAENIVNDVYTKMVTDRVLDYLDSKLDSKYPVFKSLMKEYHDGILLFNISQEEVWNKAATDSIGQKSYYNKHKSDYIWDKQCDAVIYETEDSIVIAKTMNIINDKKGNDDKMLNFLNSLPDSLVSKDNRTFVPGENKILDMMKWHKGAIHKVKYDKSLQVFYIFDVFYNKQKNFEEAKSKVISDYQQELEKNWLKSLRSQANIEVNRKLLKKLRP